LAFQAIPRSQAAQDWPDQREDCLSAASFAAPGQFEQRREVRRRRTSSEAASGRLPFLLVLFFAPVPGIKASKEKNG